MKKITFGILLLLCFFMNANAQTNADVSHWSIGLDGGANYFRANPSPASTWDRIHFVLGGTVEYSINPLAGLGVELLNNPIGGEINATTDLKANSFDVLPYFSVNLSNLLSPSRDGFWKKVNFFGETGAGVGFYQNSINNGAETSSMSLLAKVGLNAEYNLSNSWALSLKGQYRYYDRDNLAGASFSKGNCEALDATIGLRFKLGAKSKQHARSISMNEYYPKVASNDRSKACCEDVQQKLKAAQEKQTLLQQKEVQLEQKIKQYSNQ